MQRLRLSALERLSMRGLLRLRFAGTARLRSAGSEPSEAEQKLATVPAFQGAQARVPVLPGKDGAARSGRAPVGMARREGRRSAGLTREDYTTDLPQANHWVELVVGNSKPAPSS